MEIQMGYHIRYPVFSENHKILCLSLVLDNIPIRVYDNTTQ
jgi:hypothetical protein